MKRLENETDEEFEERKKQRIVRVMVGIYSVTFALGMIGYTVATILNRSNKYVKYEPVKERQEETIENPVLKKTL